MAIELINVFYFPEFYSVYEDKIKHLNVCHRKPLPLSSSIVQMALIPRTDEFISKNGRFLKHLRSKYPGDCNTSRYICYFIFDMNFETPPDYNVNNAKHHEDLAINLFSAEIYLGQSDSQL